MNRYTFGLTGAKAAILALLLGMTGQVTTNGQPTNERGSEVFLFPFFRGNGERGVFLAASDDGFAFRELNGGKPIFEPPAWPKQNLTRDPSILFHRGKFRMVWTANWTGRVFGYVESADLSQWSAPVMVRPFLETLLAEDQPENVWAPEIHWDPAQEDYLILWSTTTAREKNDGDGSSNDGKNGSLDHRIYACRTKDGREFSKAELFFDPGFSVIDAQMARDQRNTPETADDRWVMVFKHEQDSQKNLRIAFASAAKAGAFSEMTIPLIGPKSRVRPGEKAEGATLLRHEDRWLLYWDAFANGHYAMASSTDLLRWKDETGRLQVPRGARHGTVFKAPRSVVATMLK